MIEYRFRVPSAAVFTLYSYSKALEYRLEYATAGSLIHLIFLHSTTVPSRLPSTKKHTIIRNSGPRRGVARRDSCSDGDHQWSRPHLAAGELADLGLCFGRLHCTHAVHTTSAKASGSLFPWAHRSSERGLIGPGKRFLQFSLLGLGD
jgi:hypothetical protein